MMIGPIAHYHENSKYYSAIPPRPNKEVDNNLPHITIQMPVYKESLEAVLYVFFLPCQTSNLVVFKIVIGPHPFVP